MISFEFVDNSCDSVRFLFVLAELTVVATSWGFVGFWCDFVVFSSPRTERFCSNFVQFYVISSEPSICYVQHQLWSNLSIMRSYACTAAAV